MVVLGGVGGSGGVGGRIGVGGGRREVDGGFRCGVGGSRGVGGRTELEEEEERVMVVLGVK